MCLYIYIDIVYINTSQILRQNLCKGTDQSACLSIKLSKVSHILPDFQGELSVE